MSQTITDQVIALSNGKWVSNKLMMETLGITNRQRPLHNMRASKNIVCDIVKDANGDVVRYRAYYHQDQCIIELAKMRKQQGILAGIESIRFGSAA